jgi:hypothetical protein
VANPWIDVESVPGANCQPRVPGSAFSFTVAEDCTPSTLKLLVGRVVVVEVVVAGTGACTTLYETTVATMSSTTTLITT